MEGAAGSMTAYLYEIEYAEWIETLLSPDGEKEAICGVVSTSFTVYI